MWAGSASVISIEASVDRPHTTSSCIVLAILAEDTIIPATKC